MLSIREPVTCCVSPFCRVGRVPTRFIAVRVAGDSHNGCAQICALLLLFDCQEDFTAV